MRLTTRQLKRLIAEEARKIIEEEGTFAIPLVKITVGNKSASIMPDDIEGVIAVINKAPRTPSVTQFMNAMETLGFELPGPETIKGVAPQGAGGHTPPSVSERRIRRRGRY